MLVKLESLQKESEIFKEYIALLEQRFAVLYSATYYTKDVSTCRWILFANGSSVENVLLISAAIRQHILRAMLQAAKWYRYFQKLKKMNKTYLNGAGKKLTTNIYHFGAK